VIYVLASTYFFYQKNPLTRWLSSFFFFANFSKSNQIQSLSLSLSLCAVWAAADALVAIAAAEDDAAVDALEMGRCASRL
jgi:hypothetical protein